MLDPIACADTLVSERGMISFSRGGGELSFGWAAKLHNIECKKKKRQWLFNAYHMSAAVVKGSELITSGAVRQGQKDK